MWMSSAIAQDLTKAPLITWRSCSTRNMPVRSNLLVIYRLLHQWIIGCRVMTILDIASCLSCSSSSVFLITRQIKLLIIIIIIILSLCTILSNFTILSQNEKALICQWNSPFESCFGLSYIHVSQILRKKWLGSAQLPDLIKNYHFVLVHHFVPISPFCPKMKRP